MVRGRVERADEGFHRSIAAKSGARRGKAYQGIFNYINIYFIIGDKLSTLPIGQLFDPAESACLQAVGVVLNKSEALEPLSLKYSGEDCAETVDLVKKVRLLLIISTLNVILVWCLVAVIVIHVCVKNVKKLCQVTRERFKNKKMDACELGD